MLKLIRNYLSEIHLTYAWLMKKSSLYDSTEEHEAYPGAFLPGIEKTKLKAMEI